MRHDMDTIWSALIATTTLSQMLHVTSTGQCQLSLELLA